MAVNRFLDPATGSTNFRKLLTSGELDGTVRAWNPATHRPVGAPLQTGALDPVFVVAFSSDGKLLASGGYDGSVRLWQTSLFVHPHAARFAPTRDH